MERRWTTRTTVGVDVDVSYSGGALDGCRTRDIGLGGVFLATPRHAFSEGDLVELTFKVPAPTETEEHRIRAKVVRLTDDGAGMMFRDFDATAFRSLQRVMKVKEPEVSV